MGAVSSGPLGIGSDPSGGGARACADMPRDCCVRRLWADDRLFEKNDRRAILGLTRTEDDARLHSVDIDSADEQDLQQRKGTMKHRLAQQAQPPN